MDLFAACTGTGAGGGGEGCPNVGSELGDIIFVYSLGPE